MWLENLKKMKENSGKSTAEISAATGIPKSTLDKTFTGIIKEPPMSTMFTLVHYFGYTVDDLTGDKEMLSIDEQHLLETYRKLDTFGKEFITEVIKHEYTRYINQDSNIVPISIASRSFNDEYKPEISEDNINDYINAPENDMDM